MAMEQMPPLCAARDASQPGTKYEICNTATARRSGTLRAPGLPLATCHTTAAWAHGASPRPRPRRPRPRPRPPGPSGEPARAVMRRAYRLPATGYRAYRLPLAVTYRLPVTGYGYRHARKYHRAARPGCSAARWSCSACAPPLRLLPLPRIRIPPVPIPRPVSCQRQLSVRKIPADANPCPAPVRAPPSRPISAPGYSARALLRLLQIRLYRARLLLCCAVLLC
jgi:hypothetical protein